MIGGGQGDEAISNALSMRLLRTPMTTNDRVKVYLDGTSTLLLARRMTGIGLVETIHTFFGQGNAGGEGGEQGKSGDDFLHGHSPFRLVG